MQTKGLLKKLLIIIPTSVLLLNLAFAEGDDADSYQEQTDYYESVDDQIQAPTDDGDRVYPESPEDEPNNNTPDENTSAKLENSDYYLEDEYNYN